MQNMRTLINRDLSKQPSTKRTPGIRLVGVLMSCVLCLMLYALCSSMAYAADIYYSVGTNNSDLKTTSTITITGGNTAIFSAGQPDNIGRGDRITYNTSSVAYIVARLSSTQFTVGTAIGGTLTNGGSWTVNAIERTFNTLNNAVNAGAGPNPSDAAYLDTNDLTSGPYTLYIVCYGDTSPDTTGVNIGGWITDAVSYIHILPSAEARNKGRWDAGAYRLVIASGDGITVSDDNASISGVQIELNGSANHGIVSAAGSNNTRITDNIIYYAGANPPDASGISMEDGGNAGTVGKIWNNIIYDFLGTGNSGIYVDFSGSNSNAYVYNNTIYNNTTGINDASGTNSIVAKNNIAYWNGDNYGGSGTFDASSSSNLSGPNTDAQIPGINAQDGEAVQFIDVADGDFRLAATDAAAQDMGADLSADAGLSFSIDIEGQLRGRLWDIGADERAARTLNVISPTDPIVVQLGDGTVAEDFQLTFSDAANGLDIVKKGGYGTTWGSDLISSGTFFAIGGESGATIHSVFQNGAGEVIIRKARAEVLSHYHIFPSGRIVLDAAGASSITVNQTATFSEYSDGISLSGGYHAYADLIETASASSGDYISPDTPSIISGSRVTDRVFDYANDGFEEGRGSYPVIASAGNATVDFNGDVQARYSPILLLEEFYPKTQPGAVLTLYWDAADTTASGSEVWTGELTSALTPSTGLRGTAQKNDSAGDYASIQTASNISDPGTLSLWARSSLTANPSANEYIFFAGTDMNLYFDASGTLNFRINAGVDLTYAADVYDGIWHQVICTWDYTADEYALYVDGKPRVTSTASYTAPSFDLLMYFTAEDTSGTNRFAGSIDEVRIYDDVYRPTGHVLFHSRMDAATDMTGPQAGSAGAVAGGASFTSGVRGNAITFDADGEYATIPSPGNITVAAGTLEMWVKSNSAVDPSSVEQLFFGDANFNIFFDTNGRLNFEISTSVNLTDTADTYDGLWHHVKAMWDYTADQYFLYVDGKQAASSTTAYAAPSMDTAMYLGAADASDTNRYNGLIDGLLIYDEMILPYGAFNVPVSWGDTVGEGDPTVLLYWDADSTGLNIGTGSATLGGSIAEGIGISGSGIVNDASGEYAALSSAGNIISSEGSLAFWARSSGAGNPSGLQYLFYAESDFNVFFDTLGFVNFNISSGANLQYTTDIYDAGWHYVRCTWDYTNDLYELFVDGAKRASRTNSYTAPVLDATVYVTAQNNSGASRFAGSLDEMYITNSRNTPVIATAYGLPIMQPQAGMPYSYRVDVGDNLDGLAGTDLLTPLSDFTSSATNSPSEYTLEYLGNITTTGSPSVSGISVTQNANTGTVTISFTGTDPDNDTVTYVAADCEYSLDSTDGSDGTWNDMTTSETTEAFTSSGAILTYVWDTDTDTALYDGTVYARLKVKDGIGHESVQAATPAFFVDTLAPSGLGDFSVSGTATTMIALTWTAVTDDNWLNNAHYEIWHGTDRADVQSRGGTASKWDDALDADLANWATAMTTITNLTADTSYFFKIWAVDGFANEATVGDISGDTAQTLVSRVYRVQIDPIYDAVNDSILVTTSLLMRSGTIVTDLTNVTLTYIGILDDNGTLLSGNLNGPGDTVSGTANAIFYTTWDPAAGLTTNTAYTIISKISYNGEVYSGAKAFNVDELGQLTDDVATVGTRVNTLLTSVTGLDSKTDTLIQKIDDHEASQSAFRGTMQQTLTSLSDEVGAILEDTSETMPSVLAGWFAAGFAEGVQAEIITRQTMVETGGTISIRFRTKTGLSPTLTVYDPRNTAKINNMAMEEVGAIGIYEYDVTFRTVWGLGDFTVFVQEPTSQAVDSVMIDVVQGIATGGGGTADSSSISMDLLYSRITNMDSDITGLIDSMSNVNEATTGVGDDVDRLLDELGVLQSGGLDAQTITEIVGSVGAVIGEDDGQYGTILGKIAGIEAMLASIGADASTAAVITQDSATKARFIRKIATRIMELLEDGELEEAQQELLNLGSHFVELKTSMAGVPGAVTTDSMLGMVQATIDELNRMAAEKGIEDLIPPIEFGGDGMAVDPEDVIEIRNGVSELKSLMVEVRGLLDQKINEPIVYGWLESE